MSPHAEVHGVTASICSVNISVSDNTGQEEGDRTINHHFGDSDGPVALLYEPAS